MSKVGHANKYARIRRERESQRDRDVAVLLEHGCRTISGFPDYIVSRKGHVYSSLKRRVLRLRPGVKPGGYEFVGLRPRDGACSYKMVHRLVAEAFISNPGGLPEVNHLDGKKRNNAVENLEWCDRSRNATHSLEIGLHPQGADRPDAKLTAKQALEVRVATGRYRDIGKRYGVCAQTVCKIKNGRGYKNAGLSPS